MMEEYEKTMRTVYSGDTVKGTVIMVTDDEVMVNIGYKSDGIIKKEDYTWEPDVNLKDIVKAGDELEVIVVNINDGEGNVVLSKKLFMQKRILADTINSLSQESPKARLEKQALFLKCAAVNDELISKLEQKVSETAKKQKEKISEVVKIKQFRKSLERLREETKTNFIKEQEKLEQKDSDELTTISYSRRILQTNNKEMSL
jgi:transcriptional accessory protein Tex/SPT6